MNKPIPGDIMYKALMDKGLIILAANVRVTSGVTEGIFRAAKDLDSAVIFEIAKSECNQNRGYTGMTPQDYSDYICKVADNIGHDGAIEGCQERHGHGRPNGAGVIHGLKHLYQSYESPYHPQGRGKSAHGGEDLGPQLVSASDIIQLCFHDIADLLGFQSINGMLDSRS